MAKTTPSKVYESLKENVRPVPNYYDIVTSSTKIYKEFCERNSKINIDHKQYRSIIEAINLYYVDKLLDTGNMVFIPSGLGKMVIQKNKRRMKPTKNGKATYLKAPINWGESYRQGKIIYCLNESTDGYAYRYMWIKAQSYIRNYPLWVMTMTKEAKNRLRQRIESKERSYKDLYRELRSNKTNTIINKQMAKLT
jgi:hypothetical protein